MSKERKYLAVVLRKLAKEFTVPALIKYVVFVIVVYLSIVYAAQYNASCRNEVYIHLFDLSGRLADFILEFTKNFNWAFLVLLLFLIPNCITKIHLLVEKIGTHLVAYGKATHEKAEVKVEDQTKQEKRNFEKEKEPEPEKETMSPKEQKRPERVPLLNVRKKLTEHIKSQFLHRDGKDIDDYKDATKLTFTNDPILSSDALMFDCSYRYKGTDRMRRYINTLIVSDMSSIIGSDGIYKYIRIMDDINKLRKNQRYAVELIILKLRGISAAYNMVEDKYAKAIDDGILAIKEYEMKDEQPSLSRKEGWIVD